MDYDPTGIAAFYDRYGDREWNRLEETPYGRLQAIIHADFVREYVRPGDRVLDIGSGPGRFSVVAAEIGARVTVADLSPGQLEQARKRLTDANLLQRIEALEIADVCDLSRFANGQWDVTICFGGALSYALDRRNRAAAELQRVTRPGGVILASVMSRFGTSANIVRRGVPEYLGPFRSSHLESIMQTGDQPPFPSRSGGNHPAMHLHGADELAALFSECEVLAIAGSNVTLSEGIPLPNSALEPAAWDAIVAAERALNRQPGLVNSGSHLILAVRK